MDETAITQSEGGKAGAELLQELPEGINIIFAQLSDKYHIPGLSVAIQKNVLTPQLLFKSNVMQAIDIEDQLRIFGELYPQMLAHPYFTKDFLEKDCKIASLQSQLIALEIEEVIVTAELQRFQSRILVINTQLDAWYLNPLGPLVLLGIIATVSTIISQENGNLILATSLFASISLITASIVRQKYLGDELEIKYIELKSLSIRSQGLESKRGMVLNKLNSLMHQTNEDTL